MTDASVISQAAKVRFEIRRIAPGRYDVKAGGNEYEIVRCDPGCELDDEHHIVGFWHAMDFADFAYEAPSVREAKAAVLRRELARAS